MIKLSNVYVFDFETNNSKKAIELGVTHVWLWNVCNLKTLKHKGGSKISSFIEFCNNLEDYSVLYAHNLKFDGSFVLNYLLANDYKWVDKSRLRDLLIKEFTTSIDNFGRYYRIAFTNDKGNVVEFRDSSKKIPGTVKSIAESWQLPILKGEIDYRMDHNDATEITENDVAYIHNDCEIIARVLRELYKEGMIHLTASADSFAAYKKCITEENFEVLFPVVNSEIDDFIRDSYFGGLCFCNNKYQGRVLHDVKCYDVNSMYPAQMMNALLPYGEPLVENGAPREIEGYPLFITRLQCIVNLKEGHFPCLMRKSFLSIKNEYIVSSDNEVISLTLTSVDYQQLLKYYDIDEVTYDKTIYFKGSRSLFKKYITPLYEEKCKGKGVKKQLAKLRLNSLYGKFATNPRRESARPYLEDGVLKFAAMDPFYVNPIYTALPAFVSANGRLFLHDNIENNREIFVYCDTDSIHTIGDAVGLEIDNTKLGAWDLEKEYSDFKVIRQKTYIGNLTSGKQIVKACGASDSVKELMNFDNFEVGATFGGKLRPVQVKGGVVLVDTNFSINE